jgi:hypothetical protein
MIGMNANEQPPAALAPEQVQQLIDKHLAHFPLQGKQTNTLSGIELEYWAALALGLHRPVIIPGPNPYVGYIGESQNPDDRHIFKPLGNPALFEKTVSEQRIELYPVTDFWVATSDIGGRVVGVAGMTSQEAALRCVIAAHLGPEVNAKAAYWNDLERNPNYMHENESAARERLSVAIWLERRTHMTPEERAQEAEWFANGVEPIPGRPGGWAINRTRPPEWWAEIDKQAQALAEEFRRTHPGI